MPRLGLGDYVRAALRVPYNLILLAGGFLAGIVSLHPLVVWPLVAAAEILYLATMATNPRFQNVVRARLRDRGTQGSLEAGNALLESLERSRRSRFEALVERCRELGRSAPSGDTDQVSDVLQTQQSQAVNQLLWVFLRTLAHEQSLASLCDSTSADELRASIAQAESQIADPTASEPVRAAHRENVGVLRQRLENLERARQNLESVGARLARIENSIMLVQEQALTRRDPSFIEAEVRNVTEGLSSVEEMMRSMDLPRIETGTGDTVPDFMRQPPERRRVASR